MKHQQPTLRFLGATDTVTGSRYPLEAAGKRVLVDCGLFQGYKRSRERNRGPFLVPSFSAHADADGILAWMKSAEREPRMTYIIHGEPDASDALRLRIKHEPGWRARVPEHLEKISLEDPR